MMPPQSPGLTTAGHTLTRTEWQVGTPAVSSVRLVKTFWLLVPVSSARNLTFASLRTPPLPTFTTSPALTVSVWVVAVPGGAGGGGGGGCGGTVGRSGGGGVRVSVTS